ncbi:MAG: hypothetical protein ACTS4W_00485 [Candidatus Hodgkinia cicadicola]
MKCIRSSVYAIKVNSTSYFLETLNEVKWITAASMETAEQLAKIYTKRTLLTLRILMRPKKVYRREQIGLTSIVRLSSRLISNDG